MKTTVEAPRKKNDIVQCTKCQCYGHTEIAQGRILVLNAEANTTQPCVRIIQVLQDNANYAEETTQPFTKVATYIKTYKKQEAKEQFNLDKTSVT
jgi:hypothetical protein